MSTNEERREAARRKLEERLEQERQAARKRRMSLIALSGAFVVAIAAVGGFFWYRAWDNGRHKVCDYTDAPVEWDKQIASIRAQLPQIPAEQRPEAEDAIRQMEEAKKTARTAPKPQDRTRNSGEVTVNLATNRGEIAMALDRGLAPCNVNAVASLAQNGFYDGTSCHRLTASDTLSVLQCGDPTGTGMGGPGWHSPDENPEHLKKVPVDPMMAQLGQTAELVVYPRGTVAIANSNNPEQGRENTGSAQFFVVTKDSQLPPMLAVVGKVDEKGMKAIDEVAKGGIAPGPDGAPVNPGQGGKPKSPLEVKKATVA